MCFLWVSAAWCGQVVTLDALGGVRISLPSAINYEIGAAVAGIGDFNGDGFLDAAIGAPSFEPANIGNDYDTGAVFVVFGDQIDRERGELDLSSDLFSGVIVMGRLESCIGGTIDGALDVNGDGFCDIALGSAERKSGYILYGSNNPRRAIPISDLGNDGVEITYTGYSVAGAGDFNDDGYADVIFGNPESQKVSFNKQNKEHVFDACLVSLIYGGPHLPPVLDSRIRNEHILTMRGIAGARAGEYLCGNIDANSDSFSDILIVAPKGGKDLKGRAFLIEGRAAFESNLSGESDSVDYKFVIDHAVRFVRRAGDVNGDGFPDLLVGREDQSVILLWGGDHLQGVLDVRNVNPQWGVLIENAPSVSEVGDINGDGYSDIAVGLPHDSVRDKAHAGRVVFLFGGEKWPDKIDVRPLCGGAISPVEYVVIEGTQAFGAFGTSIASLGDIQNDGFGDVIIGAPFQALPGEMQQESPGAAYVIQGKSLYQSLQTIRSIFLSRDNKKDSSTKK